MEVVWIIQMQQFIGSGDIPGDAVLLRADAVLLGLLGDGNFTMVLSGYSVQAGSGWGAGWGKTAQFRQCSSCLD